MRLSRIYASELYLTSSRKDKIKATINSPKNVELVQQLSDYLDDEAKEELDEAIQEKEVNEQEAEVIETEAPEIPDKKNVFSPSYSGGSAPAPSSAGPSSIDFDADKLSFDDEDTASPDNPPAEPAAESESPVEESTAIYGEITADTDINNVDDIIFNIANDASVIKGTLNSKEDTAGVQRITVDDKELWIYYEDKVNIGDIMVNVIETLNASAYTYLSFSRLARSNNAIVFDIKLNLNEPIKSIQDIEEETK